MAILQHQTNHFYHPYMSCISLTGHYINYTNNKCYITTIFLETFAMFGEKGRGKLQSYFNHGKRTSVGYYTTILSQT